MGHFFHWSISKLFLIEKSCIKKSKIRIVYNLIDISFKFIPFVDVRDKHHFARVTVNSKANCFSIFIAMRNYERSHINIRCKGNNLISIEICKSDIIELYELTPWSVVCKKLFHAWHHINRQFFGA